MDAKERGHEYRHTCLLKEYPKERTSVQEMLNLFWESPIDVVRNHILKELHNGPRTSDGHRMLVSFWWVTNETAQWLEERIPQIPSAELVKGEASDAYGMYQERLLSYYLFNIPKENHGLQVRATMFAISLFLSTDTYDKLRPSLSKMISSVIRKHPELYWAPSVPEFLEASLAHENWTIVERALKLICAAGDTSFLTRISDLGRRAEKAREKVEDYKSTDDFDERFAAAKARSVLEETARHLRVRKTEEGNVSNFQHTVSQEIQRHMHVYKAVLLTHNLDVTNSFIAVTIFYPEEWYMKREKAEELFQRFDVSICAEGLEVTNVERILVDPDSGLVPVLPLYRARFRDCVISSFFECRFEVNQIRTTARVHIDVNSFDVEKGARQIGRATLYLHRAE